MAQAPGQGDQTLGLGNAFGLPPPGDNPIYEVARKPPPLGQNPPGNPASSEGRTKPDSFRRGRIPIAATGRSGKEGMPKRGSGLSDQGNFVTPSPTMSTDYSTGWPTNYQIPFAKIARKFKHPLMLSPQRDQLVITMREKQDPITKRTGMESRRYSILNIPAANFLLQQWEKMPTSEDEVLSARGLWKEWTIEGVVRTEEGQEEHMSKDQVGRERIFNVTVKGYAYVHNGWGNVRSGTRLWLVLKKRKPNEEIKHSPFSNATQNLDTSSVHTIGTKNKTNRPFQLAFWADPKLDTPPDSVLQYEDEFGNRHRGLALYIGMVESPGMNNRDMRDLGQVDVNLDALIAQHKIWIFVDV